MSDEGFLTEMPPIPEDEFVVFGQAIAYPEHADALERVYAETTRLAASEPGTVYYCLARDEKDRNKFHFFERYKGRKAFDAHNEQPIIQKLLKEDKYIRGVQAVTFAKAIEPAEDQKS
ncbi:ABM domain-containing protein [Mycena chlorophos]|uniref:ABM domain-containing protein n=1 Tax=Mycena chlorophos TaxID=658473 RepID=A0A8H6T060_MYCCL|nr:ABM domain-containing protein [Mycena chlorophos]